MTRQSTTLKRVLCGPDGKCSRRCQQGQDCYGSVLASQAALGLHRFFHEEEGGAVIDTEAAPRSRLSAIAWAAITALAVLLAAVTVYQTH